MFCPVCALNRRCTVISHLQPLNKLTEGVTDHDLGLLQLVNEELAERCVLYAFTNSCYTVVLEI